MITIVNPELCLHAARRALQPVSDSGGTLTAEFAPVVRQLQRIVVFFFPWYLHCLAFFQRHPAWSSDTLKCRL